MARDLHINLNFRLGDGWRAFLSRCERFRAPRRVPWWQRLTHRLAYWLTHRSRQTLASFVVVHRDSVWTFTGPEREVYAEFAAGDRFEAFFSRQAALILPSGWRVRVQHLHRRHFSLFTLHCGGRSGGAR